MDARVRAILPLAAFASYAAVSAVSLWALSYLAFLGLGYVVGWRLTAERFEQVWAVVFAATLLAWLMSFGYTLNRNVLGCIFALCFAAALACNYPIVSLYIAIAVVLTTSRGAILACGVVGLVYLIPRAKLGAYLALMASIVAIVALSFGRSDANVLQRLGIWTDTVDHLTVLGAGWGSFADAYVSWPVKRNTFGLAAPAAYNDFLQLVFETGIGSILLWLALAMHKGSLIVLCACVLSLTYFPLFSPIPGFLSLMALGHGARQ